jgi:uncharacterized protein (DUF2384 family)
MTTPLSQAAANPDDFLEVFELASGIWKGDALEKWLITPQARWGDKSPMDLVGEGKGTAVADFLYETIELAEVEP